ncbi:MAG: CotH kinase family protein [Sphingobacteriaceae bacterium]|nr:CotH kinase family protein [Sphingobacteriaceae bacterium]
MFLLFSLHTKAQTFYQLDSIQYIEIYFSQSNWDYQLDTAKSGSEAYIKADWVKINGELFNNVGVKYKGNSSYNIASIKNPFHIELDTYQEQNYQGITDIKLSNNYQDPSFIREVLSYNLLSNYMDCSRANFAKVYINGEYYGVYTNTESVNKKLFTNYFYSAENTSIKCNPITNPGTTTKCNLRYLGSDSSLYTNFYEPDENRGWNKLVKLCDSVTNYPSSLKNNMDVDRVIWMLAFNSALVNLDSYSGAFCQNYYLYQNDENKFIPVIWDLNMSFAGFPFVGSSTVSLGSANISQLTQLSPNIHATDIHWPLINRILENSTYKRMYAAHLKTIINEMIATGTYTQLATTFQNLIDTSVLSDTHKTYSYTNFQNGLNANVSVGSYSVPGIQTLMNGRNAYLQTQPEFTLQAPSLSIISNSSPSLFSNIYFNVTVNNATNTWLAYRTSGKNSFTKILMTDDGNQNDGTSGDGVFGASFILNSNHIEYYFYSENNDAGIFSPARAEHEFYEINLWPTPQVGDLVINEFLANNESDVKNEFHLAEDWIELLNTSNNTISLSNCFLSNEDDTRSKYTFPLTTTLAAKSFLIVWADNMLLPGNQLHAPFNLDEDGGNVILTYGSGKIIDQYAYPNQAKDISSGRCPDGHGPFLSQSLPTYAQYNCVVGIGENLIQTKQLIVYPVPSDKYLNIKSALKSDQIHLYNINGQCILTRNITAIDQIDVSDLPNGMYFLKNRNNECKKIIIQHE